MSFMLVLVVVCAAAYTDASGYQAHSTSYGAKNTYYGRYAGSCGNDGFYYNDAYSIVICSNGNAYYQPCAPGSRNSGHHQYGNSYYYRDFCDVNLVDYGYAAAHARPSYGHNNYGYGATGYGYGHQAPSYQPANSYPAPHATHNSYSAPSYQPSYPSQGYQSNSYAPSHAPTHASSYAPSHRVEYKSSEDSYSSDKKY